MEMCWCVGFLLLFIYLSISTSLKFFIYSTLEIMQRCILCNKKESSRVFQCHSLLMKLFMQTRRCWLQRATRNFLQNDMIYFVIRINDCGKYNVVERKNDKSLRMYYALKHHKCLLFLTWDLSWLKKSFYCYQKYFLSSS